MEAHDYTPDTPDNQTTVEPETVTGTPVADTSQPQPPGGQTRAQVPRVEHAPATPDEVRSLSAALSTFRQEVAQLRQEMRQRAGHPVQVAAPTETLEQRTEARKELIANSSHYCPGCGNLGSYPQRCTGASGSMGHAPIEMVSTDELGGDPEDHSRAPATDPDALPALA